MLIKMLMILCSSVKLDPCGMSRREKACSFCFVAGKKLVQIALAASPELFMSFNRGMLY